MTQHDTTPPELKAFRDRIDAIDDQLIALLKQRAGIVREVGRYKHRVKPGICPIRPAREAHMVARIAAAFDGSDFSPAAAATLWRTLIGASTAMEAPLPIATTCIEQDESLYWLAREYFGPFLPVSRHPSARRAIGEVSDGRAAVCVVPRIHPDEAESWWPLLMQQRPQPLRVFAHIPYSFFSDDGKQTPSGFAVAALETEPTGNDRTLIMLETSQTISQNRLNTALDAAKLDAQWLGSTSVDADTRQHVLDIRGFLAGDDAILQALKKSLEPAAQHVYILGHYAVPLTITP